jgi:hypothetical protein
MQSARISSPLFRCALMGIPLLCASCGPQARQSENAAMAACGPPSPNQFHSVHLRLKQAGPLPLDVTDHWLDGCAIIGFQLDSAGRLTDPEIVTEQPEGSGAGNLAIAVLERDLYAPDPEKNMESPAPGGEETRYAITVGFGYQDGHLVLAKRSVRKYPQPGDNL